MEVLRAHLLKFFTNAAFHATKWNEILRQADATLKTISGLSDQLECIHRTQPCPLIESLPQLKGRLEHVVQSLLEDEINTLRAYLEELAQLNNKLKSGLEIVQAYCTENFATLQADLSFYQCDNYLQPPLSSMVEWTEDVNSFYSQRFVDLKFALECFDCSTESNYRLSSYWDSKRSSSSIDSIMAKMYPLLNHEK